MAHVILATKGTYGDIVPFVALGIALRDRGNQVILVSQCQYQELAQRCGLPFDSWDTPEQYRDFITDTPLLDNIAGIKEFADRHVIPLIDAEVEVLKRHCTGNTVMVARYMGMLSAEFVAEHYGIPRVPVFLSVAQAECVDVLCALYETTLGDRINQKRIHLSLPPIDGWFEWFTNVAAFLGCWPSWFAIIDRSWANKLIYTGFLRSDEAEDGNLPDALRNILADTSVLVSAGTSNWIPARRFYECAAKACALTGANAILVSRHSQLLPDPLPPRTFRFPHLPFVQVMPRVGTVIHHGGASVCVRALAAGTPQLILPSGADRPDNAARIERLGVGRMVLPSEWAPVTLSKILSNVMASDKIRRACIATKESLLNENAELIRACISIEMLANKNGLGSYRTNCELEKSG